MICLLIKILLLVPTKVAVSTSILSKRWEYLWMWLPKLKYNLYCRESEAKRLQCSLDRNLPLHRAPVLESLCLESQSKLDYGHKDCSQSECERLRCFLDMNLPLHRAPVIESFRLRVGCSCFKPENINTWVLTAVSHCLRELAIVYESEPAKLDMLPSNLFTCKSLVFLKLAGDILLDVPRMVSLPCLKTLKLKRVKYFNDETLQRLLSNCPVLENLMVFLHEEDITRKLLTIVVPSLQSLSLNIPLEHRIDGYVIETPNLKCFDLWDYSIYYHDCLIENMPNLIETNKYVHSLDINSIIGSVSSVKRLTICSQSILDEGIVLNQLEHLVVCTCPLIFSNQLVRLLKASSKLKRLDIYLMNDHVTRYRENWNQPSTVPGCMMSSLQTLNFSTYTGEPQERDIVVYILKHALHLKTATIKSFEWNVPRSEMVKELELSSRASTTCQLIFE